jgi:hypothetical protein
MRIHLGKLAVALFAFFAAVYLPAQQKRGPSTPEERARAVQFAHDLESNPLGPQATNVREWLTRWVIEVPDISVSVCPRLLGPEIPDRKKYGTEIFSQLRYSEAAFMIESPDKAKDSDAVHAAGVTGALTGVRDYSQRSPESANQGAGRDIGPTGQRRDSRPCPRSYEVLHETGFLAIAASLRSWIFLLSDHLA